MTQPKVEHPQPEHPRQPSSAVSPPKSHLNVTKAIIIFRMSLIISCLSSSLFNEFQDDGNDYA